MNCYLVESVRGIIVKAVICHANTLDTPSQFSTAKIKVHTL